MAEQRPQASSLRTVGSAPGCTVWWAGVHDRPRLITLLSRTERHRAASLRREAGFRRFVTARALLRVVLSRQLGQPPASIVIDTTCAQCGSREHGRPELPGAGVSVSISHSGGRVGVAVATGRTVGLDVESTAGASQEHARALIDVALTPDERAVWGALPAARRGRAALTWWTRKESILKAGGWGLAISPELVEVSGPSAPPKFLRWAPEAGQVVSPDAIRLYEVRPGPGFVGALASIDGPVTVTQLQGDRVLDEASPAP